MQNISKNVWYSIINILLTVIVNLIAIRLLLNNLGSIKFGIFSIITILNSLSSLFSFGLNYTLIHYLPKQGKGSESSMDILVVLIISTLISLLLGVMAYIFSPGIASLLKVPGIYREETIVFIKCIAFTVVFLLPVQIIFAVFDALQKNYISNILQVTFSILYWVVLSIISIKTSDLFSLGIGLSILYPCWMVVLLLIFRRIWGKLYVNTFRADYKRITKKHLGSGIRYFVTNIVGYLNEPVSKLLISRFIGLETVAFFDIAMRVKNQIWGLFSKVTYPFLPFFSSDHNKEKIRNFIGSLTSAIFLAASVTSLYVTGVAGYIIPVWLKTDSSILINYVIISVVAYLMFSAVIFPVYYFFVAENKTTFLAIIQLTGSVINIILFFGLKNNLHEYAIITSHAASLLISMLVCLYLFHAYYKSEEKQRYKELGSTIKFVIPFCIIIATQYLLGNSVNKTVLFGFTTGMFITLGISLFARKSFLTKYPIFKIFTGKYSLL